jgi:hypothetical protein
MGSFPYYYFTQYQKDANTALQALRIPNVVGRLANSTNAVPRAEINFDAHSKNPLKRVESQT